ncbi:helix-turn-helix domain-containing protein [Ruminococcus sp.]
MSNRLFQGLVHQMRDSIDATIGVVDETATIIACSDLSRVGTTNEFVSLDLSDSHDIFIRDGFTYKPFGSRVKPDYAVFVEGVDDAAAKYASILAIALSNIKQYYDEKYDRNNFIKNVILDNVLPGDIVIKARELHFNAEISRAVFLIRIISANDISAYDVIQNLFPDKNKDFVFNITETDIVLVKELKSTVDSKDLEKLARSIAATLSSEFYTRVKVGIGTAVVVDKDLEKIACFFYDTVSSEFYTRVNVGIGTAVVGVKDLARSFKEAQMALEVGKVFDTDKVIVSYDNLGIARLIYHLPTTLCETFLHEVFKVGSIESLDHETLFTIQKFFENNLNVSETSRKLFVHRNTLVYRLEKIKKLTGLDLREFDHAIIFKIALMVKKYLSANPVKF